jgi:hypothetical protein
MPDIREMIFQARCIQAPLERARFLNEEILPEITALRQEIIAERALAVKEAWDGSETANSFSYSEIATEMGVSKPLVQQMVALAREIQEEKPI